MSWEDEIDRSLVNHDAYEDLVRRIEEEGGVIND